jgi:hypothetical protein
MILYKRWKLWKHEYGGITDSFFVKNSLYQNSMIVMSGTVRQVVEYRGEENPARQMRITDCGLRIVSCQLLVVS